MTRCVACLKNEANPKNFERFHHFYCDECVKRATAEAARETKISSFPRIRIKKGVDGEGRQGILFFIAGKNEHLGQAWAMVLFDDDEDPDTFKASCLEFVSGGGLPI